MPTYKVVDASQLDADLTSVASAIRTKGQTSASLTFPQGFVDAVGNISASSVLDDLLEIVSYVAPAENTVTIDFPWDAKEGAYIVVSNPPGNSASAANQSVKAQILSLEFIKATNTSTGKSFLAQLLAKRKTPTDITDSDFWTGAVNADREGYLTVRPVSGRENVVFLAGFTYYLLRVKGV